MTEIQIWNLMRASSNLIKDNDSAVLFSLGLRSEESQGTDVLTKEKFLFLVVHRPVGRVMVGHILIRNDFVNDPVGFASQNLEHFSPFVKRVADWGHVIDDRVRSEICSMTTPGATDVSSHVFLESINLVDVDWESCGHYRLVSLSERMSRPRRDSDVVRMKVPLDDNETLTIADRDRDSLTMTRAMWRKVAAAPEGVEKIPTPWFWEPALWNPHMTFVCVNGTVVHVHRDAISHWVETGVYPGHTGLISNAVEVNHD